jgi:organic hydroperoxide reductase OsmC/OhrA
MHTHSATISWSRGSQPFLDKKYSRTHTWSFDGGATVRASSSPLVVAPPLTNPAAVDPEEALVAAASSCHMLWFLALAAGRGFTVDSYTDAAAGFMTKDPDGREWMNRIELHPKIAFSGTRQPSPDDLAKLHHDAHHHCYIANSLRSQIEVVQD